MGPSNQKTSHIVILLVSFFTTSTGYSKDTDIKIQIGQSKTIALSPASGLRLSRKGIVIAVSSSSGKWKLTGHKPGFVVASSDIESKNRFLITVISKRRAQKPNKNEPINYCEAGSNSCTFNNDIVKGNFTNFVEFYKTRKLCFNHRKCRFEGQLSPTALLDLMGTAKKFLGSDFEIMIKDTGAGFIKVPCGLVQLSKSVKIIRGVLFDIENNPGVEAICRHDLSPTDFTIKAKIMLIEDNDAKEIGFSNITTTTFNNSISPISPFSPTSISKLRALIKMRKVTIIAEPTLRLIEGIKGSAKSGGEFPVVRDHGKGDNTNVIEWKQHGVSLQAEIYSLDSVQAVLKYNFSLKSPSGSSGSRSIQLNEFSSSVRVAYGVPTIVGGVDFFSQGKSNRSTPILSSIPIIGPLFTLFSGETASTKLYLWFNIVKDTSFENSDELGKGMKNFPLVPPPKSIDTEMDYKADDRAISETSRKTKI